MSKYFDFALEKGVDGMTINPNHSLREDQKIPKSPSKGMVTEKTTADASQTKNQTDHNKTTNAYKK
ncbi:hypothetical protein [Anaerosporobacter faecicola]|uniref:hypothetical protein n=1 Tax=Anaerosporobacter faecicola TaxID=2718714 RepID=UPI00143A1CA5|nr:hypothetical protein [Anaerosporobacter faecicola]